MPCLSSEARGQIPELESKAPGIEATLTPSTSELPGQALLPKRLMHETVFSDVSSLPPDDF